MRRMRLSDAAQAPVLIEEHVPQPQPQRGELLVRVYAAGVTPTELLWYPTTHNKDGEKRSRAIPGHEFSGVIAAVGEETVGFEIGQEVYGMNDWFADGAMAEYCVTQPSSVAHKPPRLTHVEAASVPIGALTAWQGLFDRARLQAGEHVMVHGGAGAGRRDLRLDVRWLLPRRAHRARSGRPIHHRRRIHRLRGTQRVEAG